MSTVVRIVALEGFLATAVTLDDVISSLFARSLFARSLFARSLLARTTSHLVRGLGCLAVALVLTACSSSDDPRSSAEPAATDTNAATLAPATTTEATTPIETTTTMPAADAPPRTDAVVPTSQLDVDADDELVLRPEENTGIDERNHWIGRNTMTDTSVEVVWSEVEGADVNYRVYRTEITADLNRETIVLDDNLLVYEGPAGTTSFVDGSVTTGTFYSYLLAVDVDGQTLSRRWANALAVTDVEPPTPITNLTSEVIDGEVILRWDPSTDNVEFASYSVSLVVDGELRYLGGGADPSQSSFVDTRPEPGVNVYSIQGVDFHDNRTEAVVVEVTVG